MSTKRPQDQTNEEWLADYDAAFEFGKTPTDAERKERLDKLIADDPSVVAVEGQVVTEVRS